MAVRWKALGRLKSGQMNQTEAKYAQYLSVLKREGRVIDWWFEGITLKLAEGLRYTPDFLVMNADCGLELHEVKGARAIFRDDAKAKVKMAAEKFPFTVRVVYPVKGRSNSWEVEDY